MTNFSILDIIHVHRVWEKENNPQRTEKVEFIADFIVDTHKKLGHTRSIPEAQQC